MFPELLAVVIISVVIFLFILVLGNDLFAIMVDEQVHHLHLIVFYASFSSAPRVARMPEPVTRYISWSLGEHRKPVSCLHIRHNGRIRFGKTGRWMKLNGEAFFSLAAPGFVWHATITCAPGIWLESLDYYVHHQAGTNLNLFSFLPLNNSHKEEIKTSSLSRYLTSMPLFPMLFCSSDTIRWEPVDDSMAKAVIRDKDRSAEALVRFNGRGWIDSITIDKRAHMTTGKPAPGPTACRFSSYADVEGYRIPMQIETDLILPDGSSVFAEYTVMEIGFDTPEQKKGA